MTQQQSPDGGVPTCYRHPTREAHIRCQRCNRPICPDCMIPASVGFQCPECVADGHRNTRQARTSLGGLVPNDASITSIVLIAMNAVVWLAINLTGGQTSKLVDWFALSPTGRCDSPDRLGWYPGVAKAACDLGGGHWVNGVADGAYWQLLTSAFTQVTISHIFFNVLNLYIMGPQLERMLGRGRFLTVFLLSALAGSALVYWIAPEQGSTIGASGAVFGLMGAYLVLAVISRSSVQGMLLWIVISFAYSFFVPGIAWQAHVGGFIGGAATVGVLALAPRLVSGHAARLRAQYSGLAGIAVVIVVAIALRSAQLN